MAETVNEIAYPQELSIFDKPVQDLGVKQAKCISYFPVNDFGSHGVIQFRIPNNSSAYIDLKKTKLNISCKIIRNDGKPLQDPKLTSATATGASTTTSTAAASAKSDSAASTDKEEDVDICAPVNNIMHSLFSRVDIALQDKILTNSDDCYGYESYMKTLLMTTKEEKQGLQSQGFFEEGDEDITSINSLMAEKGTSLRTRSDLFRKSREVDFTGPIYSSVMGIDKLIPNGIPITISLHRSLKNFCLISPMVKPDMYDIVITKASLSVCTVNIAPEIAIAHSEIMSNSPAIFPFDRTEVKKFTLAKGTFSSMINDPYNGRVPEQLILGLVRDSAQNGDFMENPYRFEHANLNFLSVTVDGQSMSIDPIQTKYGEKPEEGNYVQAYQTLNGVSGRENVNPIARVNYPRGFTLYRFQEEYESNLRKSGNMAISLRFDKALERGMCLIAFATFPDGIKVDKSRAIYDI